MSKDVGVCFLGEILAFNEILIYIFAVHLL